MQYYELDDILKVTDIWLRRQRLVAFSAWYLLCSGSLSTEFYWLIWPTALVPRYHHYHQQPSLLVEPSRNDYFNCELTFVGISKDIRRCQTLYKNNETFKSNLNPQGKQCDSKENVYILKFKIFKCN